MPSHPTQTPETYRVWRTDTPFACGRTPAAIFALMTVRSMRLKRIHDRAPRPIGPKANVARAAVADARQKSCKEMARCGRFRRAHGIRDRGVGRPLPGQRTKRKAGGFTAQINGKQVRRYKAEWTQDNAEAELAKALLKIEPENRRAPAARWRRRMTATWPARLGSAPSRPIGASSTCSRPSSAMTDAAGRNHGEPDQRVQGQAASCRQPPLGPAPASPAAGSRGVG